MKQKAVLFFSFAIGCLLFGLSRCARETEEVYPEVKFLYPPANTAYDVLDTVEIRLLVNYPKPEISMKISLLNDALTPAMNPLVISNFNTGIETTLYFVISNGQLVTGSYQLMAEAREGEIYTRDYRQIFIHEIERVLTNIVVVEQTGVNLHQIHRFDAAMQNRTEVSFPGDYAASDVSSSSRQIFIAGIHFGDLTAFNADSLTVNWTSPIISNPVQPYFTCLQQFGNHVFAGLWEGYTARWNLSGQKGVSTEITPGTFSYLLFATGKYLISASRQKSNHLLHTLEVFYIDAGGLLVTVQSDISPVIFTEPESGLVLILGNNQAGNAYARTFNPANGMLGAPYQPFDLPAKPMIAALAISPKLILIAFDDQISVYEYQKALTSLITLADVKAMRYEEISRTIWIVAAENVLVYNLNGSLLNDYHVGGELKNLHLLYNR